MAHLNMSNKKGVKCKMVLIISMPQVTHSAYYYQLEVDSSSLLMFNLYILLTYFRNLILIYGK